MSEEPCIPSGTVIDQLWRVERLLRSGGMFQVFAATHVPTDRLVTVKIVPPKLLEDLNVRMRYYEIPRRQASVRSVHMEQPLSVGMTDGGLPYLVCEYLRGGVLSELLTGGRRSEISDGVGYVIQATRALAELHACELVHGDLRPGNLFIARQPDGSPLVKVMMELRVGDPTLETAPYMAPEQLADPDSIDGRTDIYALGVVLYELLAGRRPFTATTLEELFERISRGAGLPLREVRPEVPPELARVIERAFHRVRDERWASMTDFARALTPFAVPRGAPEAGAAQPPNPEAAAVKKLILERLGLLLVETGNNPGFEGQWLGRFLQPAVALSATSAFTLEIQSGGERFSGRGVDPYGKFGVDGSIEAGRVFFRKQYRGRSAYLYQGRLENGVIVGGWHSERNLRFCGVFAMAKAERHSPEARHALEQGARSWLAGRVRFVLPLTGFFVLLLAMPKDPRLLWIAILLAIVFVLALRVQLQRCTALFERWRASAGATR